MEKGKCKPIYAEDGLNGDNMKRNRLRNSLERGRIEYYSELGISLLNIGASQTAYVAHCVHFGWWYLPLSKSQYIFTPQKGWAA